MKPFPASFALLIFSLFIFIPPESATASPEYNACYDTCLYQAIEKADQAYPEGKSVWSRSHWSWRQVKASAKAECLEEQNCDSL